MYIKKHNNFSPSVQIHGLLKNFANPFASKEVFLRIRTFLNVQLKKSCGTFAVIIRNNYQKLVNIL